MLNNDYLHILVAPCGPCKKAPTFRDETHSFTLLTFLNLLSFHQCQLVSPFQGSQQWVAWLQITRMVTHILPTYGTKFKYKFFKCCMLGSSTKFNLVHRSMKYKTCYILSKAFKFKVRQSTNTTT
jgi:hypothetical protein